jgi:NitT/TauT family transport system substrate-binding protein
MQRIGFKLAIAAVAVALATGITTQAVAEKLAVSQYGRITGSLPWAIAMKKGYFKEEGIVIEEIVAGAGGGTALRNMLASDLPYAEVATSAALAAMRSGIELKIVNTASNHIGEIALVTMADKPIRSVQDLAGKKAGYTAPKSTSEMLLRMAFDKAGIGGKVELISTGGFGPGLTALSAGGIDATTIIDPILTLQADKYRPIFAFADLIPRVTWLVGVATTDFAEKQPDKLRKLIRIRRKGVDFIYNNKQEAMDIYAEMWEAKRDEVAKFFPKYFDLPGEWTRGEFEKEGLETMSRGLQTIGEVDKPVDWKTIIDQRFLPEDLRRPL